MEYNETGYDLTVRCSKDVYMRPRYECERKDQVKDDHEEDDEYDAHTASYRGTPDVETRPRTKQNQPAQQLGGRDTRQTRRKLIHPTSKFMKYQPEHYAILCRYPVSETDDTPCGELVPLAGAQESLGYGQHLYHVHSYMFTGQGGKGTCSLPTDAGVRCGGEFGRNEMRQHSFNLTAHMGSIEGSRLRKFGGDGTVEELPRIACAPCGKQFRTYIGGNDERLRTHITRGSCPCLNRDGSRKAERGI
jgi:hypothetical protein